MSIYSEIDRLELAKQDLKLKLESKGVTVPADARISDYAALINLLPEIKESEFTNRIVDNGNSGTGKAKIYNIKGKTLVWNQKVSNCSTKAEVYGITRTKVNNYTVHYSGTSTNSTGFTGTDANINITNGHKYYAAANGAPSNIFLRGGTGLAITDAQRVIIQSTADTLISSLGIYIPSGISIDNDISFVLIDLTLMFGAGNEPSTIEEFEAIFPGVYYPYNEGTLINNNAEAIESIGFNQFNKATALVGKRTAVGGNIIDNNVYSTSDYIVILPETKYYALNIVGRSIEYGLIYFDSNKNYLSADSVSGSYVASGIFTTPKGAAYVRINIITRDVSIDNICINLSNPTKNGTYEAYKKDTCHLGLNSFRVKDNEDNIITVNGLKSAGSVYDEIVGNKYIKRIGEVDLGTLNFIYNVDYKVFHVALPIIPVSQGSGICSKYGYAVKSYIVASSSSDKVFTIGGTYYWEGHITIKDSSYTDAVTFKAAMSGVMLYYKLATPIEYELVDEINTIYDVDKNGVEKIISPAHVDGSPSTPFRASIGYPVDQEQ